MFDHSSMMFPETAHFSGRVVHETAELKPINRYLIRNRLNNISNQPLVSSRNVASTSIPKIKSMLQ